MRRVSKFLLAVPVVLLGLVIAPSSQTQGNPLGGQAVPRPNPKSAVIIDYVDSFDTHRPGHGGGGGVCTGSTMHPGNPAGHFVLIGGHWADAIPGTPEVDPSLNFIVDLRGFPAGSQAAIEAAFDTWQAVTKGVLVGTLTNADTEVIIGDGVNTYSMRNLGDGTVLASTFITWDDANNNGLIDTGEQFMEMDVVHNFAVKWRTDTFTPSSKRWYDLQSTAVHEIGHVFGLDHPSGDACDKEQTLFASIASQETKKRTLEPNGDIPGIQSAFLEYGVAP